MIVCFLCPSALFFVTSLVPLQQLFLYVVPASSIALALLAYPSLEGVISQVDSSPSSSGSSKPPRFLISMSGAKGLCQERAYVSGLEAANALGNEGVLGRERKFRSHRVIPIREDEPQVVLGRVANKQVGEVRKGHSDEDELSVGVGCWCEKGSLNGKRSR